MSAYFNVVVYIACLLNAVLFNAVCIMLLSFFLLLIFTNAFCFMLCLGLLTHSLFISSMILHHAVVLICLFFLILCSHHFLYEMAMCSLEK